MMSRLLYRRVSLCSGRKAGKGIHYVIVYFRVALARAVYVRIKYVLTRMIRSALGFVRSFIVMF
jgi:hypothetical protein